MHMSISKVFYQINKMKVIEKNKQNIYNLDKPCLNIVCLLKIEKKQIN